MLALMAVWRRRAPFLICLTAIALSFILVRLWVRSYWVGDGFEWIWDEREVATQHIRTLSVGRGGVAFWTCLTTDGTNVPAGVVHHTITPPTYAGIDANRSAWRYPFIASHESTDPLDSRWTFALPIWVVLLILLAWPVTQARVVYARIRRRCRGLCPRCGYDLRASFRRCPECGSGRPA